MRITEKTKVKELQKLGWLLSISNDNFIDQIKAFEVPTKVSGINVLDSNEISLESMLHTWNCDNDETLIKLTAKVFLGIENEKEIQNLPLIDFVRLTIHLKDTATQAAELFKDLKRYSKDPRIKAVMMRFSGTDFGIIDRFALRMGGISHDQASETPWSIVYASFREDTTKADIEEAINETLNAK